MADADAPESLGVLQALDTLTKDRKAAYCDAAIGAAYRGKARLTATALELEANAMRDAADDIERLARIVEKKHG